ncbi:FecR domain-containing protein [Bacteriovorax sp. Seq25_V]|uniref:FecR family protein n=1 Tax=Bacteriovorax sp. Seq25_V TaxID=1201288 RepID=UPI0005597E9B|nr:FecR family protein [Bacteriovorax sp. Seq25_V]
MKLLSRIAFILLWSSYILAQVAEVTLKKGIAYKISSSTQVDLELNSKVDINETIITGEKSVIKILFADKSIITLGPNTSFVVNTFQVHQTQRNAAFNLLTGKIRAEITKGQLDKNNVQVITKKVSVGVRGTEFLVNALAEKTDVALLEGKIDAQIGEKILEVEPGEYFSSVDGEIRKMTPDQLSKLLENKEEFLPELEELRPRVQSSTPDMPLGGPGVAVVPTIGIGGVGIGLATSESVISTSDEEEEQENKENMVHDAVKDELQEREDPPDIKSAKKNRKELLKENKCFYWFYKSIPGSGKIERFRRDRACDDYYFDL